MDGESVVATIFISQSKGKRDRDQNVVHSSRQKISRKSLNGKLTQQRLSKNCVKLRLKSRQEIWKNADTVFQEIKQEFESQRFQLHQASRWADQAHRDKISLYGELELRNMLFQEDHARDCQEIEELKILYASREESYDREPIDDSNPGCVRILRSRNSERLWSDPRSQSTLLFPSPRTMPCRDSGLLHDTRNIMGTSGNVFERPLAQEGLSSTIFNNSKNLASSSQELRPDTFETARKNSEMRRESLNTKISSPHFQRRSGLLKHIGGTCSHNGTMEYPLGTPGRSLACTLASPSERASERASYVACGSYCGGRVETTVG